MDNKMSLFLTGGFGCIAPNIIKYASEAISKGQYLWISRLVLLRH